MLLISIPEIFYYSSVSVSLIVKSTSITRFKEFPYLSSFFNHLKKQKQTVCRNASIVTLISDFPSI